MSRVLVTGATGFIGGRLVESLLHRGAEVRCLVRPSPRVEPLRKLGVELVSGDLASAGDLRPALRCCDVVYHLAARTSALTRRELYQTNVAGSAAVARACAGQLTPPTLVVVSSIAAAGTAVAGRDRGDADPPRPVSEYGRSKRAGELAAVAWARRLPLSVVRPAIVFGPGNREMLPIFQTVTHLRLHLVPGFKPRRVGLIHSDDLIEVLLRVAERGRRIDPGHGDADAGAGRSPPGYYFASDTEFPTYANLGRMIARATGSEHVLVMAVAEPIAWLAAAGAQSWGRLLRQTSSFNVDKLREAFAGDWTQCTRRLEQELGFRPRASLQQRLQETAQWYSGQGWI
jgi:nucleoside-diphosphate-sugar epimerase